jgi:hypothetical protein
VINLRKKHLGIIHNIKMAVCWVFAPCSLLEIYKRFISDEMGGACGAHGEGTYNILVGKPDGRRPLGRPRLRWEDNIKMDLREIGFGDVDWIHLAQDRDRWRALVNTAMSLQIP